MLAKVQSCAIVGLDAERIEVEVDITNGLERLTVVGLPNAAVRESGERVRSAIANSGFFFPQHRLTVNLAPADLRKEGPAYDLPIALGIMAATRQVLAGLEDALVVGELGLDGSVRHVNGALAMAAMAQKAGYRRMFVPQPNASEAALVEGIDVFPVVNLSDMVAHLSGQKEIPPQSATAFSAGEEIVYAVDFQDIRGQEHAKRAFEIACAGNHNVRMVGPPGSGKTLMARALPSILPAATLSESLEITRIYSVAGALDGAGPLIRARPFRAPHHTISHAGLVGGGSMPRPGEISLAHRGVLFLDELPEFGSKNLESLRQPLEDKIITISRAAGTLSFPANFMFVTAMNPCPCGYFGDERKPCTCSMTTVQRYQSRISGPLLDRIDLHVDVPRVPFEKLSGLDEGEQSAHLRQRVERARARQLTRFAQQDKAHIVVNGDMGPAEVQRYCQLKETGKSLMQAAVRQMDLTARAYHRVLKLARTIADLAGDEEIDTPHLAEALQYRPRAMA